MASGIDDPGSEPALVVAQDALSCLNGSLDRVIELLMSKHLSVGGDRGIRNTEQWILHVHAGDLRYCAAAVGQAHHLEGRPPSPRRPKGNKLAT